MKTATSFLLALIALFCLNDSLGAGDTCLEGSVVEIDCREDTAYRLRLRLFAGDLRADRLFLHVSEPALAAGDSSLALQPPVVLPIYEFEQAGGYLCHAIFLSSRGESLFGPLSEGFDVLHRQCHDEVRASEPWVPLGHEIHV